MLSDIFAGCISFSEEKCDTPDGGKADKSVYNSADSGGLAAKKICYEVEFENADTAPVEAADYQKNQCDSVYNHCRSLLCWYLIFPQKERIYCNTQEKISNNLISAYKKEEKYKEFCNYFKNTYMKRLTDDV